MINSLIYANIGINTIIYSKLSMIKNIKRDFKDIKPNKRLGQNFLIDKSALNKIISAADLSEKDIVLEIGPGTGILTRELLKTAQKVVAVEKDKKMAEILRDNFKEYKNLEVINKDILKIDDLNIKEYKLVANIPYYITSPIIRKFLEYPNPPKLMVLTIQKEVAQRICAKPPDMNLLAVSVQFYAKPEIISHVFKNSFWPKPKVDSTILKIQDIKNKNPEVNIDSFFILLKAGFKQPRKQLLNNISNGLRIEKNEARNLLIKAKIRPEQRPETLTVQNWIELTRIFML